MRSMTMHPHVVCTGNDNYVLGIAVTIRSILEHFPSEQPIRITILNTGLSPKNIAALRASWAFPNAEIQFTTVDLTPVAHLPLSNNMQSSVYTPFLIAEYIDDDRVLFVDADIIAHSDITPLWNTDIGTNLFGATQSESVLVELHARLLEMKCEYSSLELKIRELQQVFDDEDDGVGKGVSGNTDYSEVHNTQRYCNSGVLLMNLAAWRSEQVTPQLIDFAEQNPDKMHFWDQDALNIVLHDRWFVLDPEWNVAVESCLVSGWIPNAHQKTLAEHLIRNARITHCLGKQKPWKYESKHPKTPLFFDYLQRTAWAGWQPDASSRIPSTSCETSV